MNNHDEADGWGAIAPNIMAPERLDAIRRAFDQTAIIVEHRFYRGGSAPDRLIFDDFEAFEEYLRSRVRPGDDLWLWRYDELCRNDNSLTHGKHPDADGMAPTGGAY